MDKTFRVQPAPATGQNDDLSNLPGFDVAGALLRMAGNKNLLRKLLIQFHDRYGKMNEEVQDHLSQERYDDAKHTVHTVKGVAGNIGATDLYQASIALEADLIAGNDYKATLADFSEKFRTAIDVLSKTVAAPTAQNNLSKEVDQLKNLLRRSDPEACIFFETVKASFVQAAPTIAGPLEQAIEAFDYDEALRVLQKMP